MTQRATRREFLGAAAGAGAMMGLPGVVRAADPDTDWASRAPKGLKILVLGGTGQTGPHFIRRALAHGHDVTMFNRGNRSDQLFPEVECLIGDRYPERGEGLNSLAAAVREGRRWDVVLDVWPHIPRLVEGTAEMLKNAAGHYMFVSSMSVYVDTATVGLDESAEVGSAPDADSMEFSWELFGPFKAECENRVRRIFGDRHTIFRPSLIVGPRDFSHRGVYWPVRVREGGDVLAPGTGESHVQMVDGRDLAEFELRCMERDIRGTFNVAGPHPRRPLLMRDLLQQCRATTESDASFTWVPAEFLQEHGVGPWMQMPCWLPAEGDHAGFGSRKISKALGAGLTLRPVAETLEDTLQWYDALPEQVREGMSQRAGISREKEREVLDAWKAAAS